MSNVVFPTLPHSKELALIRSSVVSSKPNLDNDHRRLLESRALELLESHPHFRGRGHWVGCRCLGGCLYLEGKLPSFYLKQLAQETIRNVEGIVRIENRIKVGNPYGCDLIDPVIEPKRKPR